MNVACIKDNRSCFHVFLICITKSEKKENSLFVFQTIKVISQRINYVSHRIDSSMDDCLPGIANAVNSEFPGVKRGFSNFHLKKRIKLNIQKQCDKIYHYWLLEYFSHIQLSTDDIEFSRNASLFIMKWEDDLGSENSFLMKLKENGLINY